MYLEAKKRELDTIDKLAFICSLTSTTKYYKRLKRKSIINEQIVNNMYNIYTYIYLYIYIFYIKNFGKKKKT